MSYASLGTNSPGKLLPIGEGQFAFSPNPLPPPLKYSDALITLLSEVDRALGAVDSLANFVPNPRLLVLPFLKVEAALSSRIEGTQTTLGELFEAEIAAPEQVSSQTSEVSNYLDAMELGLHSVHDMPLHLGLVRALHAELLQGVRGAVLALLLGSLVMVVWLAYFGGSLFMALANVVLGICVFITLAWAIAQGGLIFIQPTFSSTETMTSLFGSTPFGTRALVLNMLNEQINRMDLREYMLPSLLNAHRACDEVNLDRRALLLKGLVPSIGLALIAAGIVSIALPYLAGGGISLPDSWGYQGAPRLTYRWASQLVLHPLRPDPALIAHFAAGLAATLAVMALRKNLSWFSLHPIGFLIASGYPLGTMWFSLFLAWVIKSAVMKYGGYKIYQDLRPFFLGLIIGDTLNGAIWIAIGLVTKTGYSLLPG